MKKTLKKDETRTCFGISTRTGLRVGLCKTKWGYLGTDGCPNDKMRPRGTHNCVPCN